MNQPMNTTVETVTVNRIFHLIHSFIHFVCFRADTRARDSTTTPRRLAMRCTNTVVWLLCAFRFFFFFICFTCARCTKNTKYVLVVTCCHRYRCLYRRSGDGTQGASTSTNLLVLCCHCDSCLSIV